MNQSLALVPQQSQALAAPRSLDEIQRMGELFAKSGFFNDAQSAAQAFVKIMAGQELGLNATDSMTGLHVIKGKLTVGANILARKVKASGKYNYKVLEHTDKVCRLEFFEGGQSCGIEEFTIEQARKAGTQNLDKFPKNMLFARCISNGVRFYCPDVVNGTVYTPDEFDQAEPAEKNVTPAAYGQSGDAEIPKTAKPAAEMCDRETADAITELWKHHGHTDSGGQRVPLATYLKEKLGASRWSEVPMAKAKGVLDGLQKRAVLAEKVAAQLGVTTDGLRPAAKLLADEIVAARSRGVSMEQIADLFKQYAPSKSDLDELDAFESSEFAAIVRAAVASQ